MIHTHPLHASCPPLSSQPKPTWRRLAVAVASLALASVSAFAALPARVFAPYIQVDGSTSLTSISSSSGIKYFTLAFIIDDGTHHGLWEAGSTVASDSSIAPAISNLRSAGGDVIISFGGAAGNELAIGTTSVSTLQSVYQGIINKYGVTALDFDIEGSALGNTTANDRRNQALAGLQAANPGLFISYTLPVDPTGLGSDSIALLKNAKSHGVNVACVNIMAMDYGSSTSPSMGQKAIDATNATSSQLSSNGLTTKIGITPLIGKQDTAPEVFTITDAQNVEAFALGDSQVNRIAFWEVAIDQCGSSCSGTSQSVWQFSHIFEPFSGGTTSTVSAPTFTPGAGTYTSTQSISIATTTSGASIRYTTNGTTPSETTGTLYSGPVTISATTTLKAIAYKSGMNDSSVTSGTYTINITNPGDTTITSADGFFNRTLGSAQTGSFSVDFDASVSLSPSNTNFSLCQGSATAYTGLACMVRFSSTGMIDARNGGAFAAATSMAFAANTTYHVRMDVNVATHTYSAYVTAPGGSPVTIASNYAFRTEQAAVTSLDTFDVNVGATPGGSATFGQTTVTSAPTTFTLTASAGSGGTISPSGTVTVNQGASQTFTIAPSAGNTIASVTVDGTNVGAVSTYTFSNVQANHTISASFAATPTYTITASAGTGGTITPTGSVSVAQGGSQTFTIAAGSGNSISAVTVDGTNVGAVSSYTFSNVQANHTISASFATTSGTTTVTSADGFFNRALGSTQTGSFGVDFDASVSLAPSNTTFGLCQGAQTAYTGLACVVRFSSTGVIDARNGGAYAAVTSMAYAANTTYHIHMDVNVAAHTYSATATAPGGSAVTIASNYAFRTEQASVTSLDTFNVDVAATPGGSATFGATTVTSGGVVAAPSFSPAPGSYTSAQTVSITTTTSGASIRYTTDGSTPTATTGTLYVGPISIASTTTLKAIAYKTGVTDSSVSSGTYTISSGGSLTGTSSDGFHSLAISPQTGTFTATFDATPSLSPENAVVALSQGAATAYTSMSCIARFNASGQIDAYNGTAYGAAATINYSAGTSYHFRMVVNVTAHTYSVYVTPAGGTELTVGSNYAFRSTANTVTSLDNWDLDVNATPAGASLTASNLSP
jgi:hypothetical protein